MGRRSTQVHQRQPSKKARGAKPARRGVKCRRAAVAAARARKAAQERRDLELAKSAEKSRAEGSLSLLAKWRRSVNQTGPCCAEFLCEPGGRRKCRTAPWRNLQQLRRVALLLLQLAPGGSGNGAENTGVLERMQGGGHPDVLAVLPTSAQRDACSREDGCGNVSRGTDLPDSATLKLASVRASWEEAAMQIGAWRLRDRRLPVPVEVTGVLLDVLLRDPLLGPAPSHPVGSSYELAASAASAASGAARRMHAFLSAPALRLAYGMSIVRTVNRLVDAVGTRALSRSVAAVAAELGLHQELVQMRHEATHQSLPALSLLREGALTALDYLCRLWWSPQLDRLDQLLGGADSAHTGGVYVHLATAWLATAAALVRASKPLPVVLQRANREARRRAASMEAALLDSQLANAARDPLADAAVRAAARGVRAPGDVAEALVASLERTASRFRDVVKRGRVRSAKRLAETPRASLSRLPPAARTRGDSVSPLSDDDAGLAAAHSGVPSQALESEERCCEEHRVPPPSMRSARRRRQREIHSETKSRQRLGKRHEMELLEWATEDGGVGRAGWGVRTLLQQQVFEADVSEEVAVSFCVEGLMTTFDAASYPVLQLFFLQLLPLLSPAFAVDCLSRFFLLLLHVDPLCFDSDKEETASVWASSHHSFPRSSLSSGLSPTNTSTPIDSSQTQACAKGNLQTLLSSLSPSSPFSCSSSSSPPSSASASSPSPCSASSSSDSSFFASSAGPAPESPPAKSSSQPERVLGHRDCGEKNSFLLRGGGGSQMSADPKGEVRSRAEASARRARLWQQLLLPCSAEGSRKREGGGAGSSPQLGCSSEGSRIRAEKVIVSGENERTEDSDPQAARWSSHSGTCTGKNGGDTARCARCMYTSMTRNLLSWLPLFAGTFMQPFLLPRLSSTSSGVSLSKPSRVRDPEGKGDEEGEEEEDEGESEDDERGEREDEGESEDDERGEREDEGESEDDERGRDKERGKEEGEEQDEEGGDIEEEGEGEDDEAERDGEDEEGEECEAREEEGREEEERDTGEMSEGEEETDVDTLGSLTTGVSSLGVMAVLHHYAHYHFLFEEEVPLALQTGRDAENLSSLSATRASHPRFSPCFSAGVSGHREEAGSSGQNSDKDEEEGVARLLRDSARDSSDLSSVVGSNDVRWSAEPPSGLRLPRWASRSPVADQEKRAFRHRECLLGRLVVAAQQRLASAWHLVGPSALLHCSAFLHFYRASRQRGSLGEARQEAANAEKTNRREGTSDGAEKRLCDFDRSLADWRKTQTSSEAAQTPQSGAFSGESASILGASHASSIAFGSSSDELSPSAPRPLSSSSTSSLPPFFSPWLRELRLRTVAAIAAALGRGDSALSSALQKRNVALFRLSTHLLAPGKDVEEGVVWGAGDLETGAAQGPELHLGELEQDTRLLRSTRETETLWGSRSREFERARAAATSPEEWGDTDLGDACGRKKIKVEKGDDESCAVEFLDSSEEEEVAAETPYCMYTGGSGWSREAFCMRFDSHGEEDEGGEDGHSRETARPLRADRVLSVLQVLTRMPPSCRDVPPRREEEERTAPRSEEREEAEEGAEGMRPDEGGVRRMQMRLSGKRAREAEAEVRETDLLKDLRQTLGEGLKKKRKRRARGRQGKHAVEMAVGSGPAVDDREKEEGEKECFSSDARDGEEDELSGTEATRASVDSVVFFDLHVA
ncbi:UNVERIFIED_CONTAM: Las1 family protein [Hammondia hammondi]|eukprot:XP_008888266.1 Las1 family protein [Hammondia hammondi]